MVHVLPAVLQLPFSAWHVPLHLPLQQAALLAQVCPSETQATESQILLAPQLSVQQSVGELHGVPAPEHLPTTDAQVCEVASQIPEQHVVPPWHGSLKTPHEITPCFGIRSVARGTVAYPAVGGSSAPAAWTAVAGNARCASRTSARTASASRSGSIATGVPDCRPGQAISASLRAVGRCIGDTATLTEPNVGGVITSTPHTHASRQAESYANQLSPVHSHPPKCARSRERGRGSCHESNSCTLLASVLKGL